MSEGNDMEKKTPVVIVGAGPCGLAAACGLRRRGIEATVLDSSTEPGSGSRAILLWPPVLDVLDELGVLPEAEKHGYRPRALCYHTSRKRTIRLPLDMVNGPLVLRQDRTSRLLEAALEKLGGRVERPVRVTEVIPGKESVRVNAEGPGGAQLSYEADWLIGSDGAHSTVRKLLGIDFVGTEFSRSFALAEGQVEGEFDREDAHYYVTPAGVLVVIALPGGEVRLSGALAEGEQLSLEAVQRLLDQRGPGHLRVSNPSVLTTFSAPHRVAASMRSGRCFLAGDSAHVHSPAGGQGLSLGMQDVRNLVWKLAGVIDGRLAPEILDSYDLERRAAAQQVVKSIHQLTRQTLFPPMALRVRNAVLHLLHRAGRLQNILLPSLAGRQIHYPDVLFGGPLSPGPGKQGRRNDALPAAGMQAPAWAPKAVGKNLDGFRLITSGPQDSALAQRAGKLVDGRPSLAEHRHLAENKEGFLLLRPDGYVAASGQATPQLDQAWQRLERLVQQPKALG
ncbi:FAD-dependent oxidoreductase [Stigmatella aurantiaca]|uniref:Monooxygenase AufJ n=2 Tax=Stigmatella aurantiaca TaxID=41 RepID=A8YP98_STIAU|nr:FAD-dependent monooxygenase [Stigmatella aurantiaca]ADO72994.1 Monooxygenase AufJ [Stigmatella aurantiaca DW4/3-1]EAU62091.1 monooxygenase [Stigmatella aurantiaca DW4/3-1]CAO98853.1 monooxygenase AufJ [Stigmatella aurantiaca DW4/3-1]